MSLFVDGNISQVSDLTIYESSLTDVASTEGIDLSAKMTVAKLELSLEIQKFLLSNQPDSAYGMPTTFGIGIENVVVTDALKQWHTLQAIAATFRDAYNQQLNDRYKGKWAEYAALAAHAAEVALAVGIGIIFRPLPKPERPALSETTGSLFAGTWYVAASWTNQSGVESGISETSAQGIGDGASVLVIVNKPPTDAIGWNVYIGLTNDDLYKQNDLPLQLSSSWVIPAGLQRTVVRPAEGQKADTYLRKRNLLRRG